MKRERARKAEPPRVVNTFSDEYYHSTNFASKNLLDLNQKPVKTISDVLAHYVNRARQCVAVKGAMDNLEAFKNWITTMPVKQQAFDSFWDKDGKLSSRVFDQLWSCKDDAKSPGAPLYFKISNNKGLEPMKSEIYDEVDKRAAKMVALGNFIYENDMIGKPISDEMRVELVKSGVCDVMAVGLKSEARKNGKMPRLITLASLVDNLIMRLGYQNHLVDEMSDKETYMCARLDVTTQEKTAERYKVFRQRGKNGVSDIQGFEYSTREDDQWAIFWRDAHAMGLVDKELKRIPAASHSHFCLLVAITFVIINRVTLTPEGELCLLPAGMMPSGVLLTYHRNSMIRANLSNNVSIDCFGKPVDFCMTAGDDCSDSNIFATEAESIQAHAKYGKKVTDVVTYEDDFEFCSTKFTSKGSYQLNIGKTAYNLLCERRLDSEALAAFRLAYFNHPDYMTILDQLKDQAVQMGIAVGM